MMSKKDNKKAILAVAILLVLVLGAIIAWFALRPAAPDRHPNAAATEAPAAAAPAEEEAAAPAEGEAAEPVQDAESTPAAAPADEVTIVVLVKHGDGTEKEFTITRRSWPRVTRASTACTSRPLTARPPTTAPRSGGALPRTARC